MEKFEEITGGSALLLPLREGCLKWGKSMNRRMEKDV